MKTLLKRAFRGGWKVLPAAVKNRFLELSLRDAAETEKFRVGLPSVAGLLRNVRENGFRPKAIIDVGANVGDWSRMAAGLFPESRVHMFDADPDNELHLQRTSQSLAGRAEYSLMLLGPEDKSAVTFYKLGTGSSVLPELTSFEKTPVTLPMRTLDGILAGKAFDAPTLLKLDVQGFELEVLRGAARTLAGAELVILETSLLPYNEGAPLFAEVIAFMAAAGFVAFDFCGQARRQTDYVLFQADVAFVRQQSALRAPRKFSLREP